MTRGRILWMRPRFCLIAVMKRKIRVLMEHSDWCGKQDLNSTGLYIIDQFYHMM